MEQGQYIVLYWDESGDGAGWTWELRDSRGAVVEQGQIDSVRRDDPGGAQMTAEQQHGRALVWAAGQGDAPTAFVGRLDDAAPGTTTKGISAADADIVAQDVTMLAGGAQSVGDLAISQLASRGLDLFSRRRRRRRDATGDSRRLDGGSDHT